MVFLMVKQVAWLQELGEFLFPIELINVKYHNCTTLHRFYFITKSYKVVMLN